MSNSNAPEVVKKDDDKKDTNKYYTNILEQKCLTKLERTIEYPLDILKIFEDVVTSDIIKTPILLRGHPYALYDKISLIEWFSRSNIEPVTGVKMKDNISFVTVVNFYAAMMLLEIKGNKLVFHQPDMDLINFLELASNLLKNKKFRKELTEHCNQKNDPQCSCKIVSPEYISLDHDMYSAKVDSNKEYMFFTLEDLLVNDWLTGKPIVKPIITSDGLLVNDPGEQINYYLQTKYPAGGSSGTTHYIRSDNRGSSIDGSYLLKTINNIFPEAKRSRHTIKNTKKDNSKVVKSWWSDVNDYVFDIIQYDHIFESVGEAATLRGNDFYMSSSSTYVYMYSEYMKIIKNPPKDFEKNKKILSDLVKKHPYYVSSPRYSYDGLFMQLREELKFPVICGNTYADDFSLLDLDGCNFDGSYTRDDGVKDTASMKGREFLGASLKKTTFKNFHFSVTAFIGIDLTETEFINCKFYECVFYKTKRSGKTFKNCEIDNNTMKTITADK